MHPDPIPLLYHMTQSQNFASRLHSNGTRIEIHYCTEITQR
jgi:hypothetical protein